MPRRPEKYRRSWTVCGAVVLLVLKGSPACTLSQREAARPVAVLEDPPHAVLPIRDPLWTPDLAVQGTVFGPDGKSATLWLMADSGADLCTFREEAVRGLRLPRLGSIVATGLDGPIPGQLATASRLTVGDVVVTSQRVFVVPRLPASRTVDGVIGQPILSRAPWEIDWDRGTLTLGATPWPASDGTTTIPLSPRAQAATDEVIVTIDGNSIPMMLDTGAFNSTIPRSLARRLHLEKRRRGAPLAAGAAAEGAVPTSDVYEADLKLGDLTLRRHPFAGVDGSVAALGRDVLARFDLQVIPHRTLQLRDRKDPRETAGARIARWRRQELCRSRGCVQARIAPWGDDARVDLEIEAAFIDPTAIILGCASQSSAEEPFRSQTELALLDPRPQQHYLAVSFPEMAIGHHALEVPLFGPSWFSPDGGGCRELTVLDVFPPAKLESAPPAPQGKPAP